MGQWSHCDQTFDDVTSMEERLGMKYNMKRPENIAGKLTCDYAL